MKRIVLAALFLAACTPPQPVQQAEESCAAPAKTQTIATMYFGRNIGGKLGVSEKDWDRFVDAEVTPRFPEGLSVADLEGQWKDTETDAIVHEPSKALTLFLSGEEDRKKLDEIADAYKAQFNQQAVGLVTESSCLSFE